MSTLDIFFLHSRCGLDQMLLKEEGNDSGIGKIARLVIVYPALKLKTDQLAGVDWLAGEESGEPRVVQQCELVEVVSLMCHHSGVDVVQEPVGVRHLGHLLVKGAI